MVAARLEEWKYQKICHLVQNEISHFRIDCHEIWYGYSRPLRRNSNTIGDYPAPHSDHNFKLCKILICAQVTTSHNPISVQRFHICEIMLVTSS